MIEFRDPRTLPQARIPQTPPPPTVTDPQRDKPPLYLSLDEAIRIGLANSEVVRTLGGVTAASSGRTIYDPAIANTQIDQQRARFDPMLNLDNTFSRTEPPTAAFDPLNPGGVAFSTTRTDSYRLGLGISKLNQLGGNVNFGLNSDQSRFQPGIFPLNPRINDSLDLSYRQPLLAGAGTAANRAPIVIARIDTERSYFQFKDSMQELVRGIIEAYWSLVFARTDVWAREQQVEQLRFVLDREEAIARVEGFRGEFVSQGTIAQRRVAYLQGEASLLSARANQLQREAALRNILRLPPYQNVLIVPTTPPRTDQLLIDYTGLLQLAEQQRPDLIELKLILEADRQRLIQAENQARPSLDATALYRWNGLEGFLPSGTVARAAGGQFTDWTLGVNFSVPLGLRQSRAVLRQQELLIARDRANLDQGMHAAVHVLALNLRNLDQFYAQYELFQQVRDATEKNLELQFAERQSGRAAFLVILQAIVDWGNAVSAEAQSLTSYNTELANLERQTGTILESHGIRFLEERFGSLGPLGRMFPDHCYPQSIRPLPNANRYLPGDAPSEDSFNLKTPIDLNAPLEPLDPAEEIPLPGAEPR